MITRPSIYIKVVVDMEEEQVFEKIKVLAGTDNPQLEAVYELVESRLSSIIKRYDNEFDKIPEDLHYILVEITLARFNRLGAEGMSKEIVDGHTTDFIGDEFEPYMDEINRYYKTEDDKVSSDSYRPGKFRVW